MCLPLYLNYIEPAFPALFWIFSPDLRAGWMMGIVEKEISAIDWRTGDRGCEMVFAKERRWIIEVGIRNVLGEGGYVFGSREGGNLQEVW